MSVYIIIDGYNVIRQTKKYLEAERSSLLHGREALLFDIEEFFAVVGYEGTVVFDAGGTDSLEPSSEMFGCIDVLYTRRKQSADDLIRKLFLEKNEDYEGIVIVTADRDLADGIIMKGGFSIKPPEFLLAMRAGKKIPY